MSQQEQEPAYDPLDWLDMAEERCNAFRLGDRRARARPFGRRLSERKT